jgi:hypothetical protein
MGKSWIAAALGTAGSRGHGLPASAAFSPFRTLIYTAEDGLADTLRPRLDLLGADTQGREEASTSGAKRGGREGAPPPRSAVECWHESRHDGQPEALPLRAVFRAGRLQALRPWQPVLRRSVRRRSTEGELAGLRRSDARLVIVR